MSFTIDVFSVSERLPDEGEYVLIWCGTWQVATIRKGISEEERASMKRGETPDPEEYCWSGNTGLIKCKRSSLYKECDANGNNLVPYRWYANGGPMKWFGQDVSYWAYLPEDISGWKTE